MSKLDELKVLNCCPTRYSTGDMDKDVDKRAKMLQGVYKITTMGLFRGRQGTEAKLGIVVGQVRAESSENNVGF